MSEFSVQCIWRETTPNELKQVLPYGWNLTLTKIGAATRFYGVYTWQRRRPYLAGTIIATPYAELTPAEAMRVVVAHFRLVGGHD